MQAQVEPAWHQLAYAMRGQLEVVTDEAHQLVPADRAVWIPAGTRCTTRFRAGVAVRSLYFARAAVGRAPASVRTLVVTPLLRELIVHVAQLGALDRRRPAHAHLFDVLWDLVRAADDATLSLPLPRDPRARRFADTVLREPGDARSVAVLARICGLSTRTLERCFRSEAGITVGAWRRRVRLLHARRLLEAGAAVSSAGADAGYATPSAFSHAFRQEFGRSPRQLRGPPSSNR